MNRQRGDVRLQSAVATAQRVQQTAMILVILHRRSATYGREPNMCGRVLRGSFDGISVALRTTSSSFPTSRSARAYSYGRASFSSSEPTRDSSVCWCLL